MREIETEIAISQHDHSHSHLAIHIHTSSAECRGCNPGLRRFHEIQTEIAISRHDHSHSHLAIHIHTSSTEGPDYSPALRRSRQIQTEIAISQHDIHIHTSPFTFTPRQPKGRTTVRPFGDHTSRLHEFGQFKARHGQGEGRAHARRHASCSPRALCPRSASPPLPATTRPINSLVRDICTHSVPSACAGARWSTWTCIVADHIMLALASQDQRP